MTSFSKHFMMMGIRAMGRQSFKHNTGDFFGTGMMVADLRHSGTTVWCRDVLMMSVKTSLTWFAHSEDSSRYVVWPSSLAGVDVGQDSPHAGW